MRLSPRTAPLLAAALLILPAPAALAAAAPAAPAASSAPPVPPPVDPAAKAAAEQFLVQFGYDRKFLDGISQGAARMRSGAVMGQQVDSNPALKMQRAKNPQAWDAALKKVGGMQADILEQTAKERMPQVHADAVDTYARAFTAAELKQLSELYKTPFGRKLIDALPGVASVAVRRAQVEINRQMAPRVKALQPEIQKELAPLLPKPAKK